MPKPSASLDCVQLDLLGEMHVDFALEKFTLVRPNNAGIRWPFRLKGRRVNDISPMAYRDMEWIGIVVRHQWSMLLPAVPFLLLGPFWMRVYFGDWVIFSICAFLFLFLGVFPLLLLLHGRKYVGMATSDQILLLPMDRSRKKLARILGLLKQLCPSETRWELDGTPFQDLSALDVRPPSGRGFNQTRYALIWSLISIYSDAEMFEVHGRFRPLAITVGSTAVVISLTCMMWSLFRSRAPKQVD